MTRVAKRRIAALSRMPLCQAGLSGSAPPVGSRGGLCGRCNARRAHPRGFSRYYDWGDPATDASRVQNPQWFAVVGICTHLGCVPLGHQGPYDGWFCPCHGSIYDTSGRIRQGPAPYNLLVPDYKFTSATKITIG
ncbi:MAG TPA: ubiquinol-cytochrome c reductase iron-sulfur subunit [Methylovirgula sp.]